MTAFSFLTFDGVGEGCEERRLAEKHRDVSGALLGASSLFSPHSADQVVPGRDAVAERAAAAHLVREGARRRAAVHAPRGLRLHQLRVDLCACAVRVETPSVACPT